MLSAFRGNSEISVNFVKFVLDVWCFVFGQQLGTGHSQSHSNEDEKTRLMLMTSISSQDISFKIENCLSIDG